MSDFYDDVWATQFKAPPPNKWAINHDNASGNDIRQQEESKIEHEEFEKLVGTILDQVSPVPTDHINPAHYQDVVPGLQYMDLMIPMLKRFTGVKAHLMGQIYKYLMRSGLKDPVVQDLKKAQWYLNFLIKHLEENK